MAAETPERPKLDRAELAADAEPEAAGELDKTRQGVTWRALLIAFAFSVLADIWVRQAALLAGAAHVAESVPPIPAIAELILLVGLNPLLRKFGPRFGLTRAEQITIYCFVTISAALAGPGCIRILLSFIMGVFYYASPRNHLPGIQHLLPHWLVVTDPQAVKDYYRGAAPGHGVPWHAWLMPILSWGAFLMALWIAMLCLVLLVRQRWIDSEQLTFPLVKLPLEITASSGDSIIGPRFFRNPLMWLGFSLSAIYNLINIAHAFAPWMPHPGTMFDFAPYIAAQPWHSLWPMEMDYRPDLIGFGFLVPTEICFSIWFFYLTGRIETVFAYTHALGGPGAPFEQEQSMGAFLVLGAWLLWQARHDFFGKPRPGSNLRLPRKPLLGFIASMLFLGWFCIHAGMAAWVTWAYLGVLLLTAVTTARIRSDAGIALIWLFPWYQQNKMLTNILGTAPFISATPGTSTIFALLAFLSRGYFPALIGYQAESLKMADVARVPRRQMVGVIILAAAVGILLAFWIHLTTDYAHGAENIGGGLWGTGVGIAEFNKAQTVTPPDAARTAATAVGGVIAVLLLVARQWFVHFPLHPLGYAVATAYGELVWWPFLVVWVAKASILRWGGVKAYRKAVPGFLGYALGHLFVAGVVWGLIAAFWPNAAEAYAVYFG